MLRQLQQDLRYAAHVSLRQPIISLTIVLTMALGIGVTTAIFSAVNTFLLRPLPYPNQDRLVSIVVTGSEANSEQALIMPPLLLDLQLQSRQVEHLGGFSPNWTFTLTKLGDPTNIDGSYVTPGLLSAFGFEVVAGRDFAPEEQKPGAAKVVLVTRGFWNRKFGAITGLGKQLITLDNESYAIVGIVGDEKRLPKVDAEVFLPFSANPYVTSRFAPVMNVVGLLKEGATLAQAQSELDAITQNVRKDYPPLREKRFLISSLRERMVEDIRVTLLTAFACVGFLVLIACVNVANLLLSRAMARQREIAVRAALGASRRRLMQQLLTESVFLSFSGGILGLALAYVLITFFIPQLPSVPAFSQDIHVDGWVLGFVLLLSLATGLIFGLVPAFHAATPNLMDPLKSGNKSGAGDSGMGLRSVLVVTEMAMAVVVLIAAGLLIRSFWILSHVDPGFRTARILTLSVDAADTRYKKSSDRVEFYRRLTDSLRTLPGVESVGSVNRLPLNGSNILLGVSIPGSAVTANKPEMIDRRIADAGYFQTVNIPLLKGRYFTLDDGPDSPKVAIVNQAMAQRFWPGEDPVGHQAVLALRDPMPVTVVGVVGNVLHHGLDKPVQPELYVPYPQAAAEGMIVVIRSAQVPENLVQSVRSQVWRIDSQIPLDKIPTMEEVVSTSVASPRFRTLLLSGFAALALILSALGIYGVVSYSTLRRVPEIGVRVALGAQKSNILKLILGQGVKLAVIGVLIGAIASFFVNQMLSKLLYRVTPNDPITMISVAALLILVALIACYAPARRALRINPSAALRIE